MSNDVAEFNKNFFELLKKVKQNKKIFFDMLCKFVELNKTNFNKYDHELIRLLNVLKWSDVFVSRNGSVDRRYFKLIKKIQRNSHNQEIKLMCSRLMREVKLLEKIRNKVSKEKILEKYSLKLDFYRILKRNGFNGDFKSIVKKDGIVEELEVEVNKVNKQLKGMDISKATFQSLNSMEFDNKFDDTVKFLELVQLWKFGDATIKKKVFGKFIINATTDILASYLTTMIVNSNLRQWYFNKKRNNKLSTVEQMSVLGLSEIFFFTSSHETKKLSKNKLYGVSIENWLEYLYTIQDLIKWKIFYIHDNQNLFFDISDLNKYVRSSLQKDIKIIVQRLSLNKTTRNIDINDTPFIKGKYIFGPQALYWDPIYIVSKIMREDREDVINYKIDGRKKRVFWKDIIGHAFEDKVTDYFQSMGYRTYHSIWSYEEKNKDQREIDVVIMDQQNVPVMIECKTFINPHSLEKYVFNLDKMISKKYFDKFKTNVNFLKEVGIKNEDFYHRDDKGKVKSLKIISDHWLDSYAIFLSNLVFPTDFLKTISIQDFNPNFIYWNDLPGLVDVSQQKDLEITSKVFNYVEVNAKSKNMRIPHKNINKNFDYNKINLYDHEYIKGVWLKRYV